MKKIGRVITGGGHHGRDRDGQSGRRNSSSQGSRNTDSQQSGGAVAGSPQPSPTGGGNGSRGGYQPPKGTGGGSKKGGGSKDQENDHDLPAHMKPTVSSQSRSNKIDVTVTKVCII